VAVMLIAKTAASGYKRMDLQGMETAPPAHMRIDDRRFRVLLILVYVSSALATLLVAALTYWSWAWPVCCLSSGSLPSNRSRLTPTPM
jgi:hypothetical protein